MRKILAFIVACLFLLAGCGDVEPDFDTSKVPEELVGQWQCSEYASDGKTSTGVYALYVEKDGTFSLYDNSGNPGISGTMLGSEGKVMILCNETDFYPPFCWDIDTRDVLEYEADGDTIRLGYDDIWLTFEKEEL